MSAKKGQEADIFSGASMLYIGLAAVLFCLLAIFYLSGNMGFLTKMAEGANISRVAQQQANQKSTVQGLMDELDTTKDDGGEAQVQQLKNEAGGL
jgi:hypothetical protein